jgi:hypothetical protein
MKQFLSPEQVLSLKPEAQAALREWWKPQVGDKVICSWLSGHSCHVCAVRDDRFSIQADDGCGWSGGTNKSECLPLLSIGQCIQLLSDQYFSRRLAFIDQQGKDVDGKLVSVWRVYAPRYFEDAPELIDALFAAVKAVLEVGA